MSGYSSRAMPGSLHCSSSFGSGPMSLDPPQGLPFKFLERSIRTCWSVGTCALHEDESPPYSFSEGRISILLVPMNLLVPLGDGLGSPLSSHPAQMD